MHTSHPHSHHHHHGISANALYEGIVSRCKARKVSNQICKKHDTSTVITTSSVNEEKTSTSAPAPSSSSLSPRPSHDNIRFRLSSLRIPHSTHSNGNGHTSSKRHSLDGDMITDLAQKSPTLLDESNRSATLPDATSATTTTTSSETSRISPIDKPSSKPPFLSRMFTLSSSSSSSSSSVDLKSASSASSLSSLPDATSLTTSSKGSSADASTAAVARPRARRLSTRLVSFRSSNNNNKSTSSRSRRTISESENNHPASLSEESDQPASQQFKEEEGMIHSPPQTPRLGSLPCTSASAAWTPGSNASPLRSPLSKRSFFGISNNSPSKNHAPSSPSANDTLTPRSNNAETRNGRKVSPNGKVERPTLGRRSASDTHTTTTTITAGVPGVAASSSSSWKNWMTSSPGKVQRRGTVSASSAGYPAILSTSTKEQGYETPVFGQGWPSSVQRAGGQSKHARHASDHSAALPSGVKEGRSLPLASMSPQTAQDRPRQSVSYRALSYAPPPSHAVLVPLSATGSTYSTANIQTQRQRIPHPNAQQQQQQRTSSASSSKPFVPYHPFLDERYHESSLDLSGTSGLTMEVHFNGGDDQQH